MKEKIKKLLFEYSINSRSTTRELGRKIRASQQSVSYLINTLKKKKLIEETTVVDAVKLGLVNVLVGFNFIKPESILKKQIIEELKENPKIICIEEAKEGVDLLVEFSTQNLSAFHKIHSELTYKFDKRLTTTFVFPIIVNYEFFKNYLSRKNNFSSLILFGDRETKELSEQESQLIMELVKFPNKKLINLSESLEIPIKTLIKIKQSLQRKKIIRGYSAFLNNSKLGINRQIVFLRFSSEGIKEIDKLMDYTKYNKNIVQFIKIIGEYQIAIVIESLKEIELVKEIRSVFSIEKYFIIKSEKIHKKIYLPDLKDTQKQTYLN